MVREDLYSYLQKSGCDEYFLDEKTGITYYVPYPHDYIVDYYDTFVHEVTKRIYTNNKKQTTLSDFCETYFKAFRLFYIENNKRPPETILTCINTMKQLFEGAYSENQYYKFILQLRRHEKTESKNTY